MSYVPALFYVLVSQRKFSKMHNKDDTRLFYSFILRSWELQTFCPLEVKKMLWTHFPLKMHQCQSGYDAARLDHMQRGKSANPALFSLLLTPDLLLENTVSSGAPSLMMCNHSGCLHGAFNVGRDQQAPLISRDIFVSMHVQRWLRLLEDLPLCLLTSKVPSCQGFLCEGLMQYRT